MVEGHLTADLITLHYSNVIAPFCDGRARTCERISNYLKKNYKWLESMWNHHAQTDPYWHQVSTVNLDEILRPRVSHSTRVILFHRCTCITSNKQVS